jgi:fatty-acyl-CoA synthase
VEELKIKTQVDVVEFEKTPIEERMTAFDTYEMLKQGAALNPDGPAMSFMLSGDAYDQPMVITYRDFIAMI